MVKKHETGRTSGPRMTSEQIIEFFDLNDEEIKIAREAVKYIRKYNRRREKRPYRHASYLQKSASKFISESLPNTDLERCLSVERLAITLAREQGVDMSS